MAQPELADVLLDTDFMLFFIMVTKLDMVECSTLEKILSSGECGNQKNGKTKSGGRNGKRRRQTIHVRTSIRKLIADEYWTNIVSTVAQVALSSQIFVQSCTFINHVVFWFYRFRVQALAIVVNATGVCR